MVAVPGTELKVLHGDHKQVHAGEQVSHCRGKGGERDEVTRLILLNTLGSTTIFIGHRGDLLRRLGYSTYPWYKSLVKVSQGPRNYLWLSLMLVGAAYNKCMIKSQQL